jgi:endo-1,4-beta-mannosidase
MHAIVKLSIAAFMFVSCLPADDFSVVQPKGLTVVEGELRYQGSPYRAMGVNYNSCFNSLLKDPNNRSFVKGFRILREDYQIPFIRFMASGYGHSSWKLFDKKPDEFFARMDLIVREAEQQQLGLIPSLMWRLMDIADYQNETLNALGDEHSQTRQFIRRYVTAMVERYKDSAAIYAWEIGNENLLQADLPKLKHLPAPKAGTKTARTAADKITRSMVLDTYRDIHKTIRQYDAQRIIVTGDSIPRPAAWHNATQDSWQQDTRQEWLQQFAQDTPSEFSVASFHLYKEADEKYFKGENVSLEAVVETIANACRQQGQPVWCGELGMPADDGESRDYFYRMMHSMEINTIAISAIWNFVPEGSYQKDWDILPYGDRLFMLEEVRALNERWALGLPKSKTSLEGSGAEFKVKDGQFFKGEQPFTGYGINMFTALVRKTGHEGRPPKLKDSSTRKGLETLAAHHIPFMRFSASGFYPVDWKLYQKDKSAYFQAFDELVKNAEDTGIGLIPVLFWTFFTVPDLVAEPINQWGNNDSATHEWMRRYTLEVVRRYKNSPAIWAWEFGNEYLHEADLPSLEQGRGWIVDPKLGLGTPNQRSIKDKVYRTDIWKAYSAFASVVRSIDTQRPILSGDTSPRMSAYHNHTEKSWGKDTPEQWQEIFLKDNAAMDALNVHIYHYELAQQDVGIPGLNLEAMVGQLLSMSKECGKPLYIGEFGVDSSKGKSLAQEKAQFENMLKVLVQQHAPLAALWNFDFDHEDQVQYNVTSSNHRAYMLKALQDANLAQKK